jgi:hypothetical protein
MAISGLQKTDQNFESIAWSWTIALNVAYYEISYRRHEDNFTSGIVRTASTSVNFTNLPSGHYTFYFVAVCDGIPTGYVVTEDVNIG